MLEKKIYESDQSLCCPLPEAFDTQVNIHAQQRPLSDSVALLCDLNLRCIISRLMCTYSCAKRPFNNIRIYHWCEGKI